jgi:hypothetical protein
MKDSVLWNGQGGAVAIRSGLSLSGVKRQPFFQADADMKKRQP